MANEFFLGSQRIWYAAKEPSYGHPTGALGTDAFKIVSGSMTSTHEREFRPDISSQSDEMERYAGRYSATWECTSLLLPNGNATTEPDITYLFENLFGHLSQGATSIEYLFATAHNQSLTIRDGVKTGSSAGAAEFQQHVFGAITNRMEITWGNQGNNGLAQVAFSGVAKKWGYTGNTSIGATTTNLSVASTWATLTNAKQVTEGSYIRIHTANTGGNIVVDSVNYTTNRITYAGTRGCTASKGRVVVAYNPTATTAGSPIHARLGWLTVDGSTSRIDHLGGRVTVEDNRDLLNEEVGYDSPTAVQRTGRRRVTFSLEFIARRDEVPTLFGNMMTRTANHVQVTIGGQANKKFKLIMRNAEFDMSPLEQGDMGAARIAMSGVAMGTNTNDSLKLRIL